MSKVPYYHTCQLCGANLDPGESCDCQDSSDNQVTTKVTEKSAPKENAKKEKNNDNFLSPLQSAD